MTVPTCAYCDATEGLRQLHDGGGYTDPDYTCEECFTPLDTGPCFDDLPEVGVDDAARVAVEGVGRAAP